MVIVVLVNKIVCVVWVMVNINESNDLGLIVSV